ncbi:hypothetical protein LUZ60_013867 [Juncus effusus]|nr:hypothetical protein LUZ60_013867 [Juncus effusus]
MKCNACWQELEGRAVSTTCGHLFCHEDASKILSNDATCPICDQVLSKSLMKSVDTNPGDEWTNLHTAYQKMGKRCQMMQQEIETLTKDKQELQEKYAEKSRQKRKLDEMYDQLRGEYDSMKRSAIQPANHAHNNNNNNNNFFARQDPDLFSSINMTGKREEIWPQAPKKRNPSPFDLCNNSPGNMGPPPAGEPGSRRQTPIVPVPGCPSFGSGLNLNSNNNNNPGFLQKSSKNNAEATLRNLIISPIKRPQNPNRHNLFTL